MLTQISVQDACMSCGACCAYFRVSFYGAEAAAIPESMVEDINPVYACMAGTNKPQPRCVALKGDIGQNVACSIYPLRSSACREVQAGDAQCAKARQAYGLIPITCIDAVPSSNDNDYEQVS